MKKLDQVVGHSKNARDAIFMLLHLKAVNSEILTIPEKLSVYKNKPKKGYKKPATTKGEQITDLKITYRILFLIVLIILILSFTKLLFPNGKEIFLLCLLTVLPLFPNVKRVKLLWIEIEMSTNDKEIVPDKIAL